MTPEEIFDAALEVIALVEKHTNHLSTAMRILNSAKEGFESSHESRPVNPECRSEAS